jgi:hypothetical protein
MQRWGGGVQGTYYFNNEWYVALNYGMNAGFKPTTGQNPQASIPGCNPAGYKYATLADNIGLAQMINANVWYRPIQALKLGLQYTFQDVNYYQGMTSDNNGQFGPNTNLAPAGGGAGSYSKSGYAHSLMFGGFFFF